jgi:hypothetical protein
VGQRESETKRITLDLSKSMIDTIDQLKAEWGLRNRGQILERLLCEVLGQEDADDEQELEHLAEESPNASDQAASTATESAGELRTAAAELNETTAIVLIHSDLVQELDQDGVSSESIEPPPVQRRGSPGTGIQLPGFVRRQSSQLRCSLHPRPAAPEFERGLALISGDQLSSSISAAQQHWLDVYSQPPSPPVLEASMVWLAKDIWPQSDQSDGRPFTWSLTQQVMRSFAPDWSDGETSFERVIVAAGILEDPFSGDTLAVRVPTLITRFVQRARSRQKRGTSFQAIDQAMTVHGALKLLELPTVADRPYTLQDIREAYREQAQSHHPDAGGSADAMRRLNEAYQFLKDRYWRAA